MPQDFSFDIECQFNLQEVTNALDQTKREIINRFDFKGVVAELELKENSITITTESEFKLESIKEILVSKLVKREQSPKILDFSKKFEKASDMNIRQEVNLIKALSQDQMKAINKLIKDNGIKVKTSIQGEKIRVQSSSKDELQKTMQLLRENKTIEAPLSFINFR